MASVSTPTMTVKDFLAWASRPENADRQFELDRGRVVDAPPPKKSLGLLNWVVIKLLTEYLTRRGSGFLLTNDTGIVLERDPDTLRGADVILFLRQPRAEDLNPGYVEDIPELIVEVLSSSDRPNQITRRVGQYLSRGIPLIWVIDPVDHTITTYRAGDIPRVLDEADSLTGNGILPDFACKVADLFALPGQPPPAA